MGSAPTELTGPDFKQGIATNSLNSGERILGHIDGTPALLIKEGETFFIVGATCTHYSANLNDGVIIDGTVRCPWHHACFDIATGEAVKAPALTSLPIWNVKIENGKVFANGKKSPTPPRQKKLEAEHFVIVGSGAAGHAAAEMLRRQGFAGRLTVLSEDADPPYDRPNLSKDYLAGNAPEAWMPLRSDDYYKSENIDLHLNTRVMSLDPKGKKLSLDNGGSLKFDKCLLATGGTPVRPSIPGIDLPHVHFLRSFADCRSIIKALTNIQKVVIVGAGFIGLESAASLKDRGLEVTVVAPHDLPLAHIVGQEVGALLKSTFEKNGVHFRLGHSVTKIEKDHVVLDDGQQEPADLVLVGTGIKPNISLALNAGIQCKDGILVNEYLETSAKDIYAAGDIAHWKDSISGQDTRIEHWVVAQRQGQLAARNMLGMKIRYQDIPFFWSQQFDVVLNYIGHVKSWSKSEIYGNLEEKNGAVAFYDGERVAAVLTLGRDQQSLQLEEAMKNKNQKRIKEILNQ